MRSASSSRFHSSSLAATWLPPTGTSTGSPTSFRSCVIATKTVSPLGPTHGAIHTPRPNLPLLLCFIASSLHKSTQNAERMPNRARDKKSCGNPWKPLITQASQGDTMRRIAILLAILAVAACGSDSSTSPSATNPIGAWDLQTINGSALPYTVTSGGASASILGSLLTLASNGTYNESISVRTTGTGGTATATIAEVGTWSATGGSITFNDQTDRVTYQGSVAGNTLTEINGATQVYRRH